MDVQPLKEEVNRRPLEQVNRRRLDVHEQAPYEEVRMVPRPITARSIGDSLERADHHHHPGGKVTLDKNLTDLKIQVHLDQVQRTRGISKLL